MIIATIAVATPISTIGNDRQPEDHDHHRIEDEDRHRIIGGEERIERLPHARQRVNDDAEREARTTEITAARTTMPNVRDDLVVDLARDQQAAPARRPSPTAG